MTTDQVAEAKKQQTAISRAFEGACEELGVGLSSLDVWRREQLAQLILQLVSEGELESTTLQMNAVSRFKNADADENDEGRRTQAARQLKAILKAIREAAVGKG